MDEFEIARILHLKSEIPKSQIGLSAKLYRDATVQSEISGFRF
jgi:hypothetical protein